MSVTAKRQRCNDCRNNFYNDNNGLGVKECWSLKSAKIVTRWRIGWWTQQDRRDAFTKVRVLDCYHNTGNFAYYKELPAHLRNERRARKAATS